MNFANWYFENAHQLKREYLFRVQHNIAPWNFKEFCINRFFNRF